MLETVEDYYAPRRVFYLWTTQPLSRELADDLYLHRQSICPAINNGESSELVVLLDSSGGDIHGAYQIVRFLRSLCSHLTVVVPRWAKSAATLVCLAADDLAMTDIAELGPLDPQVQRPGEAVRRSALDEYMALDALREVCLIYVDTLMPMLMVRTGGMSIGDLLAPVSEFVSNLMRPVYAQVDPDKYGSNRRLISISKAYAMRVLKERQHASRIGTSQLSMHDIEELTRKITTEYPCHDFVLDIPEVRALGLPVRRVADEEELILQPWVCMSQMADIIGTSDAVVDSKAEVAATNEASEDDNLPARKKGGAGSIDGQRTEDDSHMDSAEGFSL